MFLARFCSLVRARATQAPCLQALACGHSAGFTRGLFSSMLCDVPHVGQGRKQTVTLIPGDGIGPEVTRAVTDCISALNAPIEWERYDDFSGSLPDGRPRTSVPPEVLESIRRNKVALKGTMFTPLDKKNTNTQSVNVQLRKDLDLMVNMVHAIIPPGLTTRHDNVDIVVIRENTEGEYAGLEHEAVEGVVESLKVITYEKSLRTAQYAFEFALLNSRKKVTAVHKANIMKASDGLFLKACREVAPNFPTIRYDEMIVDNTCMQLVTRPQQFDVIVTTNLYGNITANVVAGLCGGYGIVPGANIGEGLAVFEQGARHVAKDLAGKGQSNPTATLLATVLLLHHLRLHNFASRLERAVMQVYAAKDKSVLTPDVGGTGTLAGFANAVMARL